MLIRQRAEDLLPMSIFPRGLLQPQLAPDPEASLFCCVFYLVVPLLRAIARIDGGLASGDHLQIKVADDIPFARPDLGDPAAVAVTVLDPRPDGGRGDGAEVIAGLPAPRALLHLGSVDAEW